MHGTNGNAESQSHSGMLEALAGHKREFSIAARLENKTTLSGNLLHHSFKGMPSWTEACEAAYGRSQQALSDMTIICSGIVVSWESIE